MELRALMYFEAVARRGSFTHAAAELLVAQPAVSAQIRKLERELGLSLLERTTRTVALTPAGEVALPQVRDLLRSVQKLQADLTGMTGVEPREVRLGVATALGTVDVAAALAAFHRDYASVRLVVRTAYMPDLIDEVSGGLLDLAVGPLRTALPPRLAATTIAEESLVLIADTGSDITDSLESLEQVRHRPFVSLPPGSGLYAILHAAGQSAGFEPRLQVEAPDPRTLRAYVASGLGLGLIARSDATGPGPEVRIVQLRSLPPHPPIAAVRPAAQPLSGPIRALLRALTPQEDQP